MTNFATQSGAVLAAIIITVVSLSTAISIPPAQAAVIAMPVLA